MKPNAHRPNAPAAQPKPRPTLSLVPGEGQPSGRPVGRWIALAAVLLLGGGIYSWTGHRSTTSEADVTLQKDFSQLERVYRREGMLTFLQAKARLKMNVADALKANDNDALATELAVYLFPELLPEENFEKAIAEQWAPVQSSIEASPRSNQSRVHYQELQAQIWQYETADAANPALSPVASSVLRIYQALSAP